MAEKNAEADAALPDVTKGWGLETFALKHPFVFKGGERREIEVRTPTGADIEAFIQAPGRGLRPLAARLANIDEAALDAMHGADYSRLLAFVGKFTAGTD